ncbi:MAG: hypothetical protein KAH20_10380 [Methylococcales bacterium]|nr:hypothetical protein [Methylococcales bacterium]
MKISSLIYMLFLLYSFSNKIALAESSSAFTDHYGKVNAVNSKYSHVVISDFRLHYTDGSDFYKESGAPISNIGNELKSGMPVKVSYFKNSSGDFVIKKLIIISEQEFRKSRFFNRN